MKKLIVSTIATKRVLPGMLVKDSPFHGISYVLMETEDNKCCRPLDFTSEVISECDVPLFWEEAEGNTKNETKLTYMNNIITALDNDSILVLTNNNYQYGSGCLCNKEAIEKAFDEFGCERLVMLPSSIHEVLLMPYSDNLNARELLDMVTDINKNDFVGDAKLIDMAYSFTLEEYENNVAQYVCEKDGEFHDYIDSVPTKLEKLLHRDIDFLKAVGTEFKSCAAIDITYRAKQKYGGEIMTSQLNVYHRIDTETGETEFYNVFASYEDIFCIDNETCSATDSVINVSIVAMADSRKELNEMGY